VIAPEVKAVSMSAAGLRPEAAQPVLIADCDAVRRDTLSGLVRRFDPAAAIYEVASGPDLVEVVLDRRPSLAFVSAQLDHMSGPEAVALARKSGGQLPCLIFTAPRAFPQWHEIAEKLGAYEVLKLPLNPAHIDALLLANQRRQQPTSVLVACASEVGRRAIQRVLAGSGFSLTVEETDSGRHARKLLQMAPYPLAFLDTSLPDLDGLELACQLQPLGLPTQITLLTSQDPKPVAQAARHIGVEFVLKMPFSARDIALTLHHAFGLRRPYLLNALTKDPAGGALVRVAALPPSRASAQLRT
jgi:CheY-like chemotaxis protein